MDELLLLIVEITLAAKHNLKYTLDPSGAEANQDGSLEQQIDREALFYYSRTLSTGWFIIEYSK